MKIFCIVPDIVGSRGGIQRYLCDLIETLSTRYNITYVSKCSRAEEVSHFSEENIQGIDCGAWGIFQNVVFLLNVLNQILFRKFDLIIVGHIHYVPIMAILSLFIPIPYMVCCYGVECWTYKGWLIKKGLQRASKIIAISQFTADKITQAYRGVSMGIVLIPCSASPQKFSPERRNEDLRKSLGISDEAKVLLSVGRLENRESSRYYDAVLRAFPLLQQHIKNVHYIIVGSGNDLERLRAKYRQDTHIHLPGYVDDSELPYYYTLADVFVMPGKLEGFGIVYLEALMSGVPIVTGSFDGSKEILATVPFGKSVDPDDAQMLTEAVISLLEQKGVESYDVHAMRELVIESFSPGIFTKRLLSLIEDMNEVLKRKECR